MNKVLFVIVFAFLISVAVAFLEPLEGRLADTIVLTLHNLGFVLGTGAATIIYVLNILAEKNEGLRQAKMPVDRFLFSFAWAGLALMIFVHTAEFLGEQSLVHWAKLISVLAILAAYIWFYLVRRAKKLAPQQGLLKFLPHVVLLFWYIDFFLSSFWLPGWHF